MFSNTFAGIAPPSVPGFVIAQLVGAAIGVALHKALSLEGGQAQSQGVAATSVQTAKEL